MSAQTEVLVCYSSLEPPGPWKQRPVWARMQNAGPGPEARTAKVPTHPARPGPRGRRAPHDRGRETGPPRAGNSTNFATGSAELHLSVIIVSKTQLIIPSGKKKTKTINNVAVTIPFLPCLRSKSTRRWCVWVNINYRGGGAIFN